MRKVAKRVILELLLIIKLFRVGSRRPCVCIFPSNQPWDAASNLRAWLIAPELEKLGWCAITVPEPLSLSQRTRLLSWLKPDVILLQQTRHPLNQPRLYPEYPCILDADDADYLDPAQRERVMLAALEAKSVIGGSRFVASCLAMHNPRSYVLWTSTPLRPHAPKIKPLDRQQIVVWAHASPLIYRQEAEFVQGVMVDVFRRYPCEFWLFGVTEQEAKTWFEPLRSAGGVCRAIPPLPYDDYLEKVAEAAIGLQPIAPDHEFSKGKSFGKILAYLSGQVAVVASNAVDHPIFFRNGESGMLPEHSVQSWSDAIVTLLLDPVNRARIAINGSKDFQGRLSSGAYSLLLDSILREGGGMELSVENEKRLAKCRLKERLIF